MRTLPALAALILFSAGPGFAREAAAVKTVRVACVGDSITFGAAIKDRAANCYPARLGRLLGDGWEVRNFGVNGATLLKNGDKPYWKLKAFTQAAEFAPDIVIIKLGTNDTKPQNWKKHGGQYAADYQAMIEHFRKLDSKPAIYLCSPAPVYETRWGINEKTVTGEIIPAVKQLAESTGAGLIDLYGPLSGHPEWFPDRIHPNAAGAAKIAEVIARRLSADAKKK